MRVAYEGDGLSACQTFSEIGSTIQNDWAEAAFKTLVYSLPLGGFLLRAIDCVPRVFSSDSSLIAEANNTANTKEELKERVRDITRQRQATDAMYVIGTLITLVFFANIAISSVSVLVSILAPTIVVSLLMTLHAQTQYKKALERINNDNWGRLI